MGREFPKLQDATNLIAFDGMSVLCEGTDIIRKGLDSQLGDGSYFKIPDGDEISFYNSSDVLQWTVLSTDIDALAVQYGTLCYLDSANDTIYIACNKALSGGDQILGIITISTGAYTTVGAYTSNGYLKALETDNAFHTTTKNGNVITMAAIDGKRYTVDVTTGVFDNGTDFDNNEFTVLQNEVVSNKLSKLLVNGTNGLEQRSVEYIMIPNFSSVFSCFGDYIYFSNNGYDYSAVNCHKDDYIKTMNAFGKSFVDSNFKLAWGSE